MVNQTLTTSLWNAGNIYMAKQENLLQASLEANTTLDFTADMHIALVGGSLEKQSGLGASEIFACPIINFTISWPLVQMNGPNCIHNAYFQTLDGLMQVGGRDVGGSGSDGVHGEGHIPNGISVEGTLNTGRQRAR